MENTETQTGLEKMDFKTADGVDANIEKLAQIFPEAVTETKDANGKLVRVANLEALKTLLEGKVADPNEQECYEFIWPGKSDAIMEAAKSITKTLRPCPEESKNWDSTQNLYIEGDNLEALKLLQQSYLGKVKMIYIDPPYNRGEDLIYRDNFHKSKSEFDEETTLRDEEGNKLVQNPKSNGRFHSDWCSMIYPRLKLARDLLSDDGVIFISIDDNEVHNLHKISDEIFGEKNFISNFIWFYEGVNDNQYDIKKTHEFILMYKKSTFIPNKNAIDFNVYLDKEIRNSVVKNSDRNPPSDVLIPKGFPCEIENGVIYKNKIKALKYSSDIEIENNKLKKDVIATSGWSSKDILKKFIDSGFDYVYDSKLQSTRFIIDKVGNIDYVKERQDSHIISVLRNYGTTQMASKALKEMGIYGFSYPKPINLIKFLSNIVSSKDNDHIILDFFSGSSTTAHACMQLNAEDGGNRKFIMVQLPEKTDEKSEAFKAGYKNICEIGKERIRRAGEKIKAEHATTAPNLDIGFRVLKVAESNMKDVYYSPAQTSQDLLDSLESNIKDDRTDLDLLFACLIDFGVELSLPLKSETIGGVSVHTVQSGEIPDIIACFAENIPESVVREIASRQPLRAVFRDSSFKDSPSKINVKEIFKYHSPNTTIKVL